MAATKKKTTSGADVRRFELVEGSSAKFWEVAALGNAITVRFGRLGTEGQSKTKRLASAPAAEAERATLIREKTGKGYREVTHASNKSTKPHSSNDEPVHSSETSLLAAYSDAVGLAHERKGFAVRREDDRLFALGYPHLRLLEADHPDDRNPKKAALGHLGDLFGPSFRYAWPRETARRMMRALGTETTPQGKPSKESEAAASIEGPIGVDEARRILTFFFLENPRPSGASAELVLLLEAEFGASTTCELMLTLLESVKGTAWKTLKTIHRGSTGFFQLGFLLLRLEPKEEKSARARLEKIWKASASKSPKADGANVPGALDLVLHGAAGAKRSGRWGWALPDPARYAHVTDQPRAIVECLKAHESSDEDYPYLEPDARLVFLAGEEAYASYLRSFRKLFTSEPQQVWLRETFGRIRSPMTRRLMTEGASAKHRGPSARRSSATRATIPGPS